MAFNFDKVGDTLCRIVDNPKYSPSKKNDVISVTDDVIDKKKEPMTSFQLSSGHFQPIPNIHSERSCNLVVGQSGSGKSRYICNWVKEYKRLYKNNPVYVFSSLDEDESLEPIKPLRIILDDQFLEDDINIKMYANSCLIFDDCDTITNMKIQHKVYQTMNSALNTGRHHNITVWCVNHTATGSKHHMKTIMNEMHSCVYFPANNNRSLSYMLDGYCGLDKKMMNYIKTLKSRWVCINKNYPQSCITDKNIFLLNELENL